MASVPVTIVGILTTADGNSQNATMVGMASLTGVGVGGGPSEPPSIWPSPGHPAHPIAPGGPPPGIWPGPGPLPHPEHPIAPGGQPPHPAHPIVLPPVLPGGPPVEIWPNPPEGTAPLPEHPIVLPPPPTDGLTPGGGKPPPAQGGWGYHPEYGWGYFPGPGQPQPKK